MSQYKDPCVSEKRSAIIENTKESFDDIIYRGTIAFHSKQKHSKLFIAVNRHSLE